MGDLSPRDLLRSLHDRGIVLFLEDSKLKAHGIRAQLTESEIELIRGYRGVFIDHWRCHACDRIEFVLYGIPPDLVCRECFSRLFEGREI